MEDMGNFITSDIVTDSESQFAIPDLLTCDYFQRQRHGYYRAREANCLNPYRNYVTLLEKLNDIHSYNAQHAKSYARTRNPVDVLLGNEHHAGGDGAPFESHICHT